MIYTSRTIRILLCIKKLCIVKVYQKVLMNHMIHRCVSYELYELYHIIKSFVSYNTDIWVKMSFFFFFFVVKFVFLFEFNKLLNDNIIIIFTFSSIVISLRSNNTKKKYK